MICNNKYCLYFSIKRLVLLVVFDRQGDNTKVDLKGNNDFSSFLLGTTGYLSEIKILHEKRVRVI